MSYNNSPLPKRREVTVVDVARGSYVSCTTLTRVLSGCEFVSETARTYVMKAVEHPAYVANLQVLSLKGRCSQISGLLMSRLDNSYVGTQGIDKALARVTYDLMSNTSHRRPDKESFYVNAIMSKC